MRYETSSKVREHVNAKYHEGVKIFELTLQNSELLLQAMTTSTPTLDPPPLSTLQVKDSDLDSLAKVLLHDLEPIKRLIADTVSAMISNARRTGDSLLDDHQHYDGGPKKKAQQLGHISSSPQNRIVEESNAYRTGETVKVGSGHNAQCAYHSPRSTIMQYSSMMGSR